MVRKLKINESKTVLEVNKGYSSKVYDALTSDFADSDGYVDADYISDQVELWLMNTRKLYDEIFNGRRKPHVVAYEAMLSLFQDVARRYDTGVRITSEMAKQWLKRNGLNYVEVLEPVIARINEERDERKAENESCGRRSFKESDGRTIDIPEENIHVDNIDKIYATNDINGNHVFKIIYTDGTWEYLGNGLTQVLEINYIHPDKFFKSMSGFRSSKPNSQSMKIKKNMSPFYKNR